MKLQKLFTAILMVALAFNASEFTSDAKKKDDSNDEENDSSSELKASEAEAEYVAKRIAEILENEFKAQY